MTNPPLQSQVLKACPFCNWPAMAMRDGANGPWAVYCNDDGTCGDDAPGCGAKGPDRDTEAEAIAAWNHRIESTPPTDEEWIEAALAASNREPGDGGLVYSHAQVLRAVAAIPRPSPANGGEWQTMDSAPTDGTEIEVLHADGGLDLVYWQQEGRCCVLGSRAGSYPPGWTSVDAGNLPVDEPVFWRTPAASLTPPDDRIRVAIEALERLTSNRHVHVAGSITEHDRCAKCGRDLRDAVHYRDSENEGTDLEYARAALTRLQGEPT